MAVVKFSGLVTSMVGKVNGSVMQGSPYGTILRSNFYGRRPQSALAYKQRSVFAAVASFNRAFTSTQQSAFQAFAVTLTRPTKAGADTPYNWWSLAMHVNGNLKVTGGTLITDPFTVPSIPDLGALTVSYSGGTSYWDLAWASASGFGYSAIIRVSPPVSARTPFKLSRMRVVTLGNPADGNVHISQSSVTALFGSSSVTVPRWFAIEVVHSASGWSGPIVPVLFTP